ATITRTPITTTKNGTTREQAIITATRDDVTIAIITETHDGATRIIPPNAPRLCIAFPLFGTESFCFPSIINSETFKPREERDGIYLGPDATPIITSNKALMSTAAGLYAELLHCASAHDWQGLHTLALLPPRSTYDWLDQEWYDDLLSAHIITPARNAPILTT